MKPSKSRNVVAETLQGYACLNAFAGLIMAFFIADDLGTGVAVLIFTMSLLASFLLYAFGEVIKLLHEIKLNTSKSTENECSAPADVLIQDEAVIYFCKNCADAYSGDPNTVRYCPECRHTLYETTMSRATWRAMSDSEKEKTKKRWSAE